MDHSVHLDKLPDGIEFPEALRDHIFYDAENRSLVYRGFMSKGDYDRLRQLQLHDNWDYKNVIDQLFQKSTNDNGPGIAQPRPPINWTIWIIVVVAGIGLVSCFLLLFGN